MKLTSLGLVATVMFVSATAEAAPLLLNGSFENNTTAVSIFNMPNAQFDVTVADATAFGTAQEIDLVTSTDFGIAPQDGNWKLGLHTQANPANFDAFSFDLAAPIVAGATYDLSFWAALFPGFSGNVDVGISNSASSFGTLVFTGAALSTQNWNQLVTTFIAPSNALFLTVRTGIAAENYAFVDNFSLESVTAVPEPAIMLLLGGGGAAMAVRRRMRK